MQQEVVENQNYYQKKRACASPFKGMKKRSFAEHDLRMGWRGNLAISNRPREIFNSVFQASD